MKSGTVYDSANRERITSKHITNAIARMLTTSEVDDMGFTSKSMRKGGLSTAKRTGVSRALRCRQSGHQSNAHKSYESDNGTDPKVTRTRRVASRQENFVSITCTASRKCSDFDSVVACKDFVRYQQEWTNE